METRIAIFAAVLTACLTSCETPQVFVDRNPVTGETSSAVKDNFVPNKGPFLGETQVYPMRITTAEGKPQFMLGVRFAGSDWLFVQGPLIANIDGQIARFDPMTSARRDVQQPGPVVVEDMSYLVERNALSQIASAHQITMQLNGTRGTFFLSFTPTNIDAFRQFLAANP